MQSRASSQSTLRTTAPSSPIMRTAQIRRQMRRACDYVRRLAESEEPVEFICFASQHDNLVVPRDSQVLACAEAIWFEKIGHLAMMASDEVLAKLIDVVARPLKQSASHLRANAPQSIADKDAGLSLARQ